jgi:hypothetical protein
MSDSRYNMRHDHAICAMAEVAPDSGLVAKHPSCCNLGLFDLGIWGKTKKELQRLGFGFKREAIVFAYLAAFYLVIQLVFHWG